MHFIHHENFHGSKCRNAQLSIAHELNLAHPLLECAIASEANDDAITNWTRFRSRD